ncbi:hypothetical protein [Saccharothrix luteola]|uniref:hypothetical protein n=1 Tax=Saccharothrix luteola TaxID=2893018 RepID=UPI001E3CE789|nr:hypothetical protein [Saccharothrix luteola]MCC8250499.1 hypothetical protein [Saccharothrix luteola]
MPAPVRPGLSVVIGLALAPSTLAVLAAGALLVALLVLPAPGLADLLIDLTTDGALAVLAAGAALTGLLVAIRLHGRCHHTTARRRAAQLRPDRMTAFRLECHLHPWCRLPIGEARCQVSRRLGASSRIGAGHRLVEGVCGRFSSGDPAGTAQPLHGAQVACPALLWLSGRGVRSDAAAQLWLASATSRRCRDSRA